MIRRDRDRELREEVQAHLDMAARDRIEQGESAQAAADAARREFGNVTLVHETTREMWGWGWLERFTRDVQYGARLLRRTPAFSIVAILSLAIGIGANTAIFQVIDAIRLSALPVERPHDLVEITPVSMEGSRGNRSYWRPVVSNPIWEAVRDRQEAFSGVFAWGAGGFNLAAGGERRPARGLWASGSLFDVLGVRAAHGRLLGPGDDYRGCEPRVVLSYPFWQREYGGDPSVIGRAVTLDSRAAEIVGVAAPGFFGLEVGRSFDVAVPICAEPALSGGPGRLDSGTDWWLIVMGRLKPGTTIEQASAHLGALSGGIFEATLAPNYPPASVPAYLAMTLHALPASTGVSYLRQQYEAPLWMLLALAAVVLVIACANLANLMLARATARGREIAIRLSLGASRGRVTRQLIIESALLSVIGAACGLALAGVFSRALAAFVDADQNALFLDLSLDWPVLTFTTAVAALTCLLFGVAPAISATGAGAGAALQHAGRGLTAGRHSARLRRGLIVAQVALCFVLIVAALLFTRTVRNLAGIDPGFAPEGIVFTLVDFRNVELPVEQRVGYKEALVERLRALAGVEGAAETMIIPLTGSRWGNSVTVPTPSGAVAANTLFNRVGDRYFATFRTPFLAGRDFDDRDTMTAPRVAIVSETFARHFFAGRDAVGSRFNVQGTPTTPPTAYEIVGVVADARYVSLRAPLGPVAYLPTSQDPQPGEFAVIATRSGGEASAVTPAITRALREVHENITLSFHVFSTVIERTLARERLVAALSICFGTLAALLAMVGLYGVIAYTVTQRTSEIGVRMALGASSFDVVRMVLRESATLVALGLAAGLVLAVALGRTVSSLLFGLDSSDPTSMAGALALLSGVALIASLVPARAAARIPPTIALRGD